MKGNMEEVMNMSFLYEYTYTYKNEKVTHIL